MQPIAIPHTDLRVSPICLGTADWYACTPEQLDVLYTSYRAAGGNVFDTAHCYAFWADREGEPERLLGQLVRRHERRREDVVVCTKGCHITGGPKYPRPDRYMTPALLASDLRDSLDRLQMEFVDVYYLHRDDPRVPIGEILDALWEHQDREAIRHVAASNWRTDRLQQAADHARSHGRPGFVGSQILWNLGHLSKAMPPDICVMDDAQQAWYADSALPVFAYSATANGYFARGGQSQHGSYENDVSEQRRQRVVALAAELGATPNQIALTYLLSHPFPTVAITGTKSAEHLRDALGAPQVRLTEEQVASLRG